MAEIARRALDSETALLKRPARMAVGAINLVALPLFAVLCRVCADTAAAHRSLARLIVRPP